MRIPARQGFGALPAVARPAVSAALGRDIPSYRIASGHDGLQARNAANHLAVQFAGDGVSLRAAGAGSLGLRVARFGRAGALALVGAAAPVARANRVTLVRPGFTEWYVNGPVGLEQGFTLPARPAGGSGAVRVELALSGSLAPGARLAGDAVRFGGLDYGGLAAWDASGRALPAHLALDGRMLSISVDDRRARYPLTIDPFVQVAALTASDGATADYFGWSVATANDVIAVGAPHSLGNKGSVYVFVKPGGGWASATQTAKLTVSTGAVNDQLGFSVAMSGDTIVAGAPVLFPGTGKGQVVVFAKPGGGWASTSTPTATLSVSSASNGDNVGYSVGVSGGTIVTGAPGTSTLTGAAYVFVRSGASWTSTSTPTATLTVSGLAANSLLGNSIAVDTDAVVVGAQQASAKGRAYVFVKPGGGWAATSSPTAVLSASDGANGDLFGASVTISGGTIAVGSPVANSGVGKVYVFVQLGGGWATATQTARLTATGGASGDNLGDSVAVSSDVVVGGADGAASSAGKAYIWVKPASGWADATQTSTLSATGGAAGDQFALASGFDGNAIAFGAFFAGGSNAGSAYAFSAPPGTPTGVSASAGAVQATVTWAAPASGGSTITGYTVTATDGTTPGNGGQTCPWSSGPLTCTVTGLTNGDSYTFTVQATTSAGNGPVSAASNAVVPAAASVAKFVVTGSAGQTAGTSQTVTITAKSAGGATVTGYTGDHVLQLTGAALAPNSTAPTATDKTSTPVALGSNTTLTFASGVATASLIAYKAESALIAAASSGESIPGSTGGDRLGVTVSPAAASSFSLALASPQNAGGAFTGTNTLTALDAYGNTPTGYNAASTNVTLTTSLGGTVGGLHGGNVLNQAGDFSSGVANLTTLGLAYTGATGAGTFTATAGAVTGTSASVTISSCGPGTYLSGGHCVAASPGFYVPGSGATSQSACAVDTFQSAVASTACLPCPLGTGTQGQTAQAQCTANAPPPTVTGVSPSSGLAGVPTTITITGSGFSSPAVFYGSNGSGGSCAVTTSTASSITCTTGRDIAAGTTVKFTVSVAGTPYTAATATFTATASCSAGTFLTPSNICQALTTCPAGSFTVSPGTATSDTICAVAGNGGANYTCAPGFVKTGVADSGTSFVDTQTCGPAAAPTIDKVTPTRGQPLAPVLITITGKGFSAPAAVTYKPTDSSRPSPCVVLSTTRTKITCKTLSDIGTGEAVGFTVSAGGGTSEPSSDTFTGAPAPVVSGLSPAQGVAHVAATVTLAGTNFGSSPSSAVHVTYGPTGTESSCGSVTFISSTALVCVLGTDVEPGHSVVFQVTDPDTALSSAINTAASFTAAAPPKITSIGPTSLVAGVATPVTIQGTGFVAGGWVDVTYGPTGVGSQCSNAYVTGSAVSCTTGVDITGPVEFVVTTGGQQSAPSAPVPVLSTPSITTVSPPTVTAGSAQTVTLSGSGFGTNASSLGNISYVVAGGPQRHCLQVAWVSASQASCQLPATLPAGTSVQFLVTADRNDSAMSTAALSVVAAAVTWCPTGYTIVDGQCQAISVDKQVSVSVRLASSLTISVTSSQAMAEFKSSFASDLATSLHVSTSRIAAFSLTPSSYVHPAAPGRYLVVHTVPARAAASAVAIRSFAVTWTPAQVVKRPITLTIRDPRIRRGDAIYSITPFGLQAVGAVTGNGVAVAQFTRPSTFVVLTPPSPAAGYTLVTAKGVLARYGGAAARLGSAPSKPVVAAASDPVGLGGAATTADGRVSTWGDVASHGSVPAKRDRAPISAVAVLPGGRGYLLAGRDGSVYAFGKAHWLGALPKGPLASPVTAVALTADGRGYLLIEANGTVHPFGDAPVFPQLRRKTVSAAVTAAVLTGGGTGLLLVQADGDVLRLGQAGYYGDAAKRFRDAPIVGIDLSPTGRGYALVSGKGTAYRFGDAKPYRAAGKAKLAGGVVAVTS